MCAKLSFCPLCSAVLMEILYKALTGRGALLDRWHCEGPTPGNCQSGEGCCVKWEEIQVGQDHLERSVDQRFSMNPAKGDHCSLWIEIVSRCGFLADEKFEILLE